MNKKKKISGGKKRLSFNAKFIICMVPSLFGIILFYLIPFLRVLYYSFINDQFARKFVWLDNYVKTLGNEYFKLALFNSFLLILICVPVLILLSILFSVLIFFGSERIKFLRSAFVLPMLIPSACIALVWQLIPYDRNPAFPIPIYFMFIWKTIGICIIFMTSAIASIPDEVYEAAKLDGAGFIKMHLKITVPLISPTVFFSVLFSITCSFRIYKETYLLLNTKYPPSSFYTIQFYMNNNFLKLNYQSLATSSVIITLLLLVIIIGGLKLQRRYYS